MHIQDGVIIPFTASELTTAIAALPFFSVSLFADIISIYSLLKQRNIPLDTRFIISMIAADLGYALTCLIIAIINGAFCVVIRNYVPLILLHLVSHGGWAIGKTGKRYSELYIDE